MFLPPRVPVLPTDGLCWQQLHSPPSSLDLHRETQLRHLPADLQPCSSFSSRQPCPRHRGLPPSGSDGVVIRRRVHSTASSFLRSRRPRLFPRPPSPLLLSVLLRWRASSPSLETSTLMSLNLGHDRKRPLLTSDPRSQPTTLSAHPSPSPYIERRLPRVPPSDPLAGELEQRVTLPLSEQIPTDSQLIPLRLRSDSFSTLLSSLSFSDLQAFSSGRGRSPTASQLHIRADPSSSSPPSGQRLLFSSPAASLCCRSPCKQTEQAPFPISLMIDGNPQDSRPELRQLDLRWPTSSTTSTSPSSCCRRLPPTDPTVNP